MIIVSIWRQKSISKPKSRRRPKSSGDQYQKEINIKKVSKSRRNQSQEETKKSIRNQNQGDQNQEEPKQRGISKTRRVPKSREETKSRRGPKSVVGDQNQKD